MIRTMKLSALAVAIAASAACSAPSDPAASHGADTDPGQHVCSSNGDACCYRRAQQDSISCGDGGTLVHAWYCVGAADGGKVTDGLGAAKPPGFDACAPTSATGADDRGIACCPATL